MEFFMAWVSSRCKDCIETYSGDRDSSGSDIIDTDSSYTYSSDREGIDTVTVTTVLTVFN